MIRAILLYILLTAISLSSNAKAADNNPNRLADRVFDFYQAGQADSIYHLGQSYLARYGMSKSDFKVQVSSLHDALGSIEKADPWNETEGGGYTTYYRQLHFGQFSATMVTTFDRNDSLSAFAVINVKALKAPNELDLTVGADSLQLPARLTMPEKHNSPVPAVVLVHGSGPCDMNESLGLNFPFLDLAKGLSKLGIAVLRYDKRTLAFPSKWVKGRKADYDAETVDDAISAVSVLSRIPDIDSMRIFVIGHSLGAALAPRIASHSSLVAGIVLMAPPARKLTELLSYQLNYVFADSVKATAQLNTILRGLSKSYIQFDADYSPILTAATLNLPILLLQGGRDYQVTNTDYQLWLAGMNGHKNFSHRLYPSLNHLFISGKGKSTPQEYNRSGHVDKEVINDICSWILHQRHKPTHDYSQHQ